jgi:NAD(P)-dependent dehydrogenase (short-subunit alcohol dehydrogenase family)
MEQTQTYIVTGGNAGLGYQCARFLGADGGNLVVQSCPDIGLGSLRQSMVMRVEPPNLTTRSVSRHRRQQATLGVTQWSAIQN